MSSNLTISSSPRYSPFYFDNLKVRVISSQSPQQPLRIFLFIGRGRSSVPMPPERMRIFIAFVLKS